MGLFSSITSGISSVLGIASGVAGVAGAYQGYEASKEAEKQAKKRAKDLEHYANLEYEQASEELLRTMTVNISQMFNEQIKQAYDLSQAYIQKGSEDYYNISVRNWHSGGISESSIQWDLMAKYDSELAGQLAEIDNNTKFMERELVMDYNYNMAQLALNRDKMKSDIGYSLSDSLVKSNAVKWESFNTGIKSAFTIADTISEFAG